MSNRATTITSATTTLVKSGGGKLARIIINKPLVGAVISIYDGLSAVNAIGIVTFPATLLGDGPRTIDYGDVHFQVGLCIVTSAATDLTVVWR